MEIDDLFTVTNSSVETYKGVLKESLTLHILFICRGSSQMRRIINLSLK